MFIGVSMSDFTAIICVDFDGVIHSYSSGWRGVDVIADAPVRGAIEWLEEMLQAENVKPVIYSSRSKNPEGIEAMKNWFFDHGMDYELLKKLEFPTQKPAAFLTIDDRAICFEGLFPTREDVLNFKPWNKK